MSRKQARRISAAILTVALSLALSGLLEARAEPPAGCSPTPMTLAVIGVKNEIKDPNWENQLIGSGISHLVLQALYDTGRYVPIEDNPEIVAEVDRLIGLQWAGAAPRYGEADAARIAADLKTEAVAWARAISFSTSRRRSSFGGLVGGARTTVTVEVEIFVKEKDRPVISARGKGKASTDSLGVFFQIRKDKVYFDQTTVGKATQEAVTAAVKELKFP